MDSGTRTPRPDEPRGSLCEFRDGWHCRTCLHWFWESDGLWHSLIPKALSHFEFGPPSSLVTFTTCPYCGERERDE